MAAPKSSTRPAVSERVLFAVRYDSWDRDDHEDDEEHEVSGTPNSS